MRLAIVMVQREVDGINAGLVLFAFAGIAEATNPVVGLDAQLLFKRMHKSAEHVHQHALATQADDFHDFFVGQRGEDQRFFALKSTCLVDLSHRLVCFIHRVGKGQPNTSKVNLELVQDGVAKGFSGNTGAIGDKEYGAIGHDERGFW